MKILNSKEAFEAMMAGRNIMCRAAGELMDFDDLSQFPATIFAMPGYEFCIKVETMELAGITFTKPLTLDDIREGQDIYVINTYGSSIYVVEFSKMTSTAFIESINNGFTQHDSENAKLQLQAISKVLGRELSGDCLVVRLGGEEKPEKKRRSRKAKEDTEQVITPAGLDDAAPDIEKPSNLEITTEDGPIDSALDETDPVIQKFTNAINKCSSDYELQGVERNLNGHKQKLHETEYAELNRLLNEKREGLNGVKKPVAAEILKGFSAQNDACTAYIQKINRCATRDEIYLLSQKIITDDKLNIEQQQALVQLTNDQANKLDPVQPEPIADEVIKVVQPSLIDQIENTARKQAAVESAEHGSASIDLFYKKKKQVLINRIYDMDSVETLERLAPAIPAAKLLPADHQELLSLYAQRKDALIQAAKTGEAS